MQTCSSVIVTQAHSSTSQPKLTCGPVSYALRPAVPHHTAACASGRSPSCGRCAPRGSGTGRAPRGRWARPSGWRTGSGCCWSSCRESSRTKCQSSIVASVPHGSQPDTISASLRPQCCHASITTTCLLKNHSVFQHQRFSLKSADCELGRGKINW